MGGGPCRQALYLPSTSRSSLERWCADHLGRRGLHGLAAAERRRARCAGGASLAGRSGCCSRPVNRGLRSSSAQCSLPQPDGYRHPAPTCSSITPRRNPARGHRRTRVRALQTGRHRARPLAPEPQPGVAGAAIPRLHRAPFLSRRRGGGERAGGGPDRRRARACTRGGVARRAQRLAAGSCRAHVCLHRAALQPEASTDGRHRGPARHWSRH